MQHKFKGFLVIFASYITITGIVTFSMFILEESFQTIMFSTWPAQDANRWDIVVEGTKLMETATTTLNWVNYCFGWIQPLAFISYRSYAKSEEFYIKALRAKALAHAPELFVGQKIDFTLSKASWRKMGHLYISNTRIRVITRSEPTMTMKISGILIQSTNNLYVANF